MHGCGVRLSRQADGDIVAEEGQFLNDLWVGSDMACSMEQVGMDRLGVGIWD
jgi:hypothetical protein